jgi:Zn-finger nucleic acid-binding protein
MNYRDGLICGICRGEKVVKKTTRNSDKVDICPKCNGSGYLPSSAELQERHHNKKQVLLKG